MGWDGLRSDLCLRAHAYGRVPRPIIGGMHANFHTVAVIGTGAMGRGIAQVAAQAGCQVRLFDQQSGAVAAAIQFIQAQWERQRGRPDRSA